MSQNCPEHVFKSHLDQEFYITKRMNDCIRKHGNQVLNTSYIDTKQGICHAVWDGIMCWDHTNLGQTAVQRCPFYIAGFDTKMEASKQCLSNGHWFSHEGLNNVSWTNYTLCITNRTTTVILDVPKVGNMAFVQEFIPVLKSISQIGYLISLLTLIVAFLILLTLKKLHCSRNTLHLNLFASFIFRAFMAILKHSVFIDGLGTSVDSLVENGDSYFLNKIEEQNWGCKMLTSLWQYFIAANYSWIFVEGLYLHNLILLELFADGGNKIRYYVLMGWGIPVLIVMPWVIARKLFDDCLCWTTNYIPDLFLIIRIPTMISILVNFALFVNVTRVLFIKLSASVMEENARYRKWARSTLVLVPLFGVHYTIFLAMSYSIGVNPTVEIVWLFCDQTFASFQGFFVAVLFCFLNGEVRAEISIRWKKIRYRIMHWLDSFRPEHTPRCTTQRCAHGNRGIERFSPVRGSTCTNLSYSSLCSSSQPSNRCKVITEKNWNIFFLRNKAPSLVDGSHQQHDPKLNTDAWCEIHCLQTPQNSSETLASERLSSRRSQISECSKSSDCNCRQQDRKSLIELKTLLPLQPTPNISQDDN